jgi:hypothetical protein
MSSTRNRTRTRTRESELLRVNGPVGGSPRFMFLFMLTARRGRLALPFRVSNSGRANRPGEPRSMGENMNGTERLAGLMAIRPGWTGLRKRLECTRYVYEYGDVIHS